MKTLTDFLNERRSHPDLNPRLSAYDQLLKYKDDDDIYISMTEVNKLGINPQSDYYTPLGIYTYPLKVVWTIYRIDRKKTLQNLPYRSDTKFIQVAKYNGKGKFMDVSDYSSRDYDNDMAKLRKMYSNQNQSFKEHAAIKPEYKKLLYQIHVLYDRVGQAVENKEWAMEQEKKMIQATDMFLDRMFFDPEFPYRPLTSFEKDIVLKTNAFYKASIFLKNFIHDFKDYLGTDPYPPKVTEFLVDFERNFNILEKTWLHVRDRVKIAGFRSIDSVITQATEEARHRSPVTSFWNVTRWVANLMMNPDTRGPLPHMSIRWNKLMRDLGYAGFSDKKGKGVIHPSEPIQAVFFSKSVLTHLDTIRNVDYTELKTELTTLKSIEDYLDVFNFHESTILNIVHFLMHRIIDPGSFNSQYKSISLDIKTVKKHLHSKVLIERILDNDSFSIVPIPILYMLANHNLLIRINIIAWSMLKTSINKYLIVFENKSDRLIKALNHVFNERDTVKRLNEFTFQDFKTVDEFLKWLNTPEGKEFRP